MFIGHYAVGFASKRAAPRTSLGALIAAALLLDLLWPLFLLAGVETVRIEPGNTAFTPLAFDSYPWSHSLVMAMVWAGLFGTGYYAFTHYARGAAVLAAGVVSHWVLDVVAHRPDMPLAPGAGPKLGFGLWSSIPATIVVELLMLTAGAWVYLAATRPRDRAGRWGVVGFLAFLVLLYAGNAQGQAPPSARALAWLAMLVWLMPPIAWWVDAHRTPRAVR